MKIMNVDGHMVIIYDAVDEGYHQNNPLHYMCRLMKEGIPLKKAREMALEYENTRATAN